MNIRRSILTATLLLGISAPVMAQASADDARFIAERSIFLRDRRPVVPPVQDEVSVVAMVLEEQFTLCGVVFAGDGFQAFVEDRRNGGLTMLQVGEPVAAGQISEIRIDGIVYQKNGPLESARAEAVGAESVWVGIGHNLAGKPASLKGPRP